MRTITTALLTLAMMLATLAQPSTLVAQQLFLGELVTNSDIEPDAELSLIVLHGGEDDQAARRLAEMLARPQTQALQQWVAQVNVQFLAITHALAEHSYSELLQRHPSYPIVALVQSPGTQGEGAIWWECSPPQLQLDEAWIAGSLTQYYLATIEAKQRAGLMPRGGGSADLNSTPPGWISDEPPAPYTPRPRRPSILNPQINHNVQVPDQIDTAVTANMGSETRQVVVLSGVFLVIASAMIAYAIISHGRTLADAETMDPQEYQRMFGPMDPSQQSQPQQPQP